MLIIGEKVNATRKSIREAVEKHDELAIRAEIESQDSAGATYIDLNAGIGGDNSKEKNDLGWLVDIALDCTEKKISLDAAGSDIVAAAVEHLEGQRPWMLNSVNLEQEDVLKDKLDLVAEHDASVIALAMDSDGIPEESARRIEICERIYEIAMDKGISARQIFFDGLVVPVAANIARGKTTLETIRGVKDALPDAKTVIGLSNISHGLKQRPRINSAFLIAAISHGLDAAICDPTQTEILQAGLLGDLISGNDRHCRRFSKAIRKGTFD